MGFPKEIVHPLLLELGDLETSFGTCKRCDRAMASVMEANLLLFKTVIAGWFDMVREI